MDNSGVFLATLLLVLLCAKAAGWLWGQRSSFPALFRSLMPASDTQMVADGVGFASGVPQ
jgi:hypothetical protein